MGNPVTGFLVALQFLTISPAFIRRIFTARELGQATAYFPLVGLLVGAVLWGAASTLGLIFPAGVTAALLLALWVGLSGALHLDGFLDACDGLLGGFDAESRLRIMRDERVGGFALAGGVLLLLVKYSALASLLAGAPGLLPVSSGALLDLPWPAPALLLAPVLGRWGMAQAIAAFPYARPQGLGRDMKDQATWRQALLAGLLALGAALLLGGWWGLAVFLAAGLALLLAARFTLSRIPGLTGDIYGAINELVEVVVLLVFVVTLP